MEWEEAKTYSVVIPVLLQSLLKVINSLFLNSIESWKQQSV